MVNEDFYINERENNIKVFSHSGYNEVLQYLVEIEYDYYEFCVRVNGDVFVVELDVYFIASKFLRDVSFSRNYNMRTVTERMYDSFIDTIELSGLSNSAQANEIIERLSEFIIEFDSDIGNGEIVLISFYYFYVLLNIEQ